MHELTGIVEALASAVREVALAIAQGIAAALADLALILGTRPTRPTDIPAWRRAARGIDCRMLSPRWTYRRSYPC